MKIDQSLVTRAFQVRNGTSGMYHDLDDVRRIQEALKKHLGIIISESEGIDFWHWRCNEWDGSWFGIDPSHTADGDIIEWFQKFVEFVGVETDEDSGEYSPPNAYALKVTGSITPFPTRVGVKVLVKDGEGALWEVELDPSYHSQLLDEIESQIPEESTGGSIRYSLEYDPAKVWNTRKVDES